MSKRTTRKAARTSKRELIEYHYALQFSGGEFLDKDYLLSGRADIVLNFDTEFEADKFRRDNFPCTAVHLWERYRHGEEMPYGIKAYVYYEIPAVVYVRVFSEVTIKREGATICA